MRLKMFYYLYKITNKLNGMYYIGVHQTKNLNDGYMGSGTLIQEAIEKYGSENFEKEILEFFNNSKDMYSREKEIVNNEFINNNQTYNMIVGGHGLTSEVAKQIGSLDHVRKIRAQTMREVDNKLWKDPERKKQIRQNFSIYWNSAELRKKQSDKMTRVNNENWKNPEYIEKQRADRLGTVFIINIDTGKKKRIWPSELIKYPSDKWLMSKKLKNKILNDINLMFGLLIVLNEEFV